MKKALEFIILLLIYLALVTTPLALIVYAYLIENI